MFDCPYCTKQLKTKRTLQKHISTIHVPILNKNIDVNDPYENDDRYDRVEENCEVEDLYIEENPQNYHRNKNMIPPLNIPQQQIANIKRDCRRYLKEVTNNRRPSNSP